MVASVEVCFSNHFKDLLCFCVKNVFLLFHCNGLSVWEETTPELLVLNLTALVYRISQFPSFHSP